MVMIQEDGVLKTFEKNIQSCSSPWEGYPRSCNHTTLNCYSEHEHTHDINGSKYLLSDESSDEEEGDLVDNKSDEVEMSALRQLLDIDELDSKLINNKKIIDSSIDVLEYIKERDEVLLEMEKFEKDSIGSTVYTLIKKYGELICMAFLDILEDNNYIINDDVYCEIQPFRRCELSNEMKNNIYEDYIKKLDQIRECRGYEECAE